MKYKRFWLLFLAFVILICILISKKSIMLSYINSDIDLNGIHYSARQILDISEILDNAKALSKSENIKYKYIFFNPYGSGFMNHNPIPNDLDLEVGINLGEYNYDGSNGDEVAESIMKAIESFGYSFNFCLNSTYKDLYTDISPFELLTKMTRTHNYYKKSIIESLNYVANGTNHVKYVQKIFNNKKYNYKVDYPYYLSSNEILLTGYPMVKIFSDRFSYNTQQKKYMREITLIPNFFITLKYKDSKIPVEISPETVFGARLQLKRRFFATSIFANRYSLNFLKNTEILNDDEKYFFYRMLSFRRHLMETENIKNSGMDRPIKMFKRLIQTANMFHSVIGEDMYNEIVGYAENYLNNPDIQLLNECANIYGVVYSIQKAPILLVRLNNTEKTQTLYKTADEALGQLYARNIVDKKHLDVLKNYHEKKLQYLSSIKEPADAYLLQDSEITDKVKEEISAAVRSLIKDADKIDKFINYFEDILVSAGYHQIYIYWLNEHTLGILKDDFTSKIDDLQSFAQNNDLTAMKYKIVTAKEIPTNTIKYEIWVRNNPTEKETETFNNLKQTLLDDRKSNLKIKKKYEILPKYHI